MDLLQNRYGTDEKIILLTTVSMFLPFYLSLAILGVNLFYIMYRENFKDMINAMPYVKWLAAFIAYSAIISIIYKNALGFMATFAMFLFFAYFMFFRIHITKELMKDCIKVMMVMGAICFTITNVKYFYILLSNKMSLQAMAAYSAQHREISSFFNPNYYAMICEFMAVIGVFYAGKSKDIRAKLFSSYLTIAAILSLVATGSRSALPAAIIILIGLCFAIGKKKIGLMGIVVFGLIIYNILTSDSLFPRFGGMDGSLDLRLRIWEKTIGLVQSNLLVGEGPLTVLNAFPSIASRVIPHAHNLILDAMVNYGLLGIAILVPFATNVFKEIMKIKEDDNFKLIVALFLVVIIHGMTDVTIFWHQTAYIFAVFAFGLGKVTVAEISSEVEYDEDKAINVARKLSGGYVLKDYKEQNKPISIIRNNKQK